MAPKDFLSFRSLVFQRYEEKRFDDILELAREAGEKFPQHYSETVYWTACTRSVMGQPDQAIATLEAAMERGACWHPAFMGRDPDFEPLRSQERFQAILRRSGNMIDALDVKSRPDVLIYPPDGAAADPPLLMALHGGADTAQQFSGHWTFATKLGLLVAIPQSSQHRMTEHFWWGDPYSTSDRGSNRARQDLTTVYEKHLAPCQLDRHRTVLGGISQGGALAIDLALEGRIFPIKGFIAVVPAIHDVDHLLLFAEAAAARRLRGWILVGEKDWGLPNITKFHREATRRGLECHLEAAPGIGHEFPADFEPRLKSALDFVLPGRSSPLG